MRKGFNPNKDNLQDFVDLKHRIIIPLHIPHLDSYYKEVLEILKITLHSIYNTKHKDTAITIAANGCSDEVISFLHQQFQEDLIDELILSKSPGKLNSILKAVRGNREPFFTITDADILFLPGWLEQTFKIFNEFPKAGVVGIIPQTKMHNYLGKNVIFDNLLSKKLAFRTVLDEEAIKKFYKSINREGDYSEGSIKMALSIEGKNKIRALVGSGHVVATYKRELFLYDHSFSTFKLGGDSEYIYLDLPVVKKGCWRLTTEGNYGYHMGNTIESWMKSIDFSQTNNRKEILEIQQNEFKQEHVFWYFIKTKLFSKLFKIKFFERWFLKYKGLPSKMIDTY